MTSFCIFLHSVLRSSELDVALLVVSVSDPFGYGRVTRLVFCANLFDEHPPAAEGSELRYVVLALLFLTMYENTPICSSLRIFSEFSPQRGIFIKSIVSMKYWFCFCLENVLFKNLKYGLVVEL
jgi:hypothetical protein